MKRILMILALLVITTWVIPSSLAKPRHRRHSAVFIGGGASTGARHRRARRTVRRGVVEREQLQALKNKRQASSRRQR